MSQWGSIGLKSQAGEQISQSNEKHFRNPKADILLTRELVFVVDDDPSMLKGIKRLLREYGFNARPFASGDALLSQGDFSKAFCAILDINLNGRSGIELRRDIANKDGRLPVIFITGNDSDANRSAAIEAGCIAYLTKPFSARSLIEPVERARAEMT